tara:strand:- start:1850 stop:2296 length:447 start_codon:yes stop_codon:yes gene_type:complete
MIYRGKEKKPLKLPPSLRGFTVPKQFPTTKKPSITTGIPKTLKAMTKFVNNKKPRAKNTPSRKPPVVKKAIKQKMTPIKQVKQLSKILNPHVPTNINDPTFFEQQRKQLMFMDPTSFMTVGGRQSYGISNGTNRGNLFGIGPSISRIY